MGCGFGLVRLTGVPVTLEILQVILGESFIALPKKEHVLTCLNDIVHVLVGVVMTHADLLDGLHQVMYGLITINPVPFIHGLEACLHSLAALII